MAVYVFSDLHDRYDLFQKIKERLSPEDTCVCLGDSIDRGDGLGIKIIQEMRSDKRFIPVLGNHEEMMETACSEYEVGSASDLNFWYQNGGEGTFNAYLRMGDMERASFLKYLKKLPLRAEYRNPDGLDITLCHSGFSPGVHDESDPDIYLWCRNHRALPWCGAANQVIVHGHTFNKGKVCYCLGHKYNLDVASYSTGKAVLLNLDTLDFEVISI